MEWTEDILDHHRQLLEKASIFGVVGISQFPYNYNKEVWRAFCEQWGPLTNTFHHGGGELGISLNDLKKIGGLPILGDLYEEYLPPNEQLTKYPSTVAELLRTHAKLCSHLKTSEVPWLTWVEHFYRGKQRFSIDHSTSRKRKCSPLPNSKEKSKTLPPLQISAEGELAGFLALLLSRFVLPSASKSVRPETFVMAALMAQGQTISLAPVVLGHIYHGLGKVATFQGNPGSAKPSFGAHFVVGWLAEYFPGLYPRRLDDEFGENFPSLARYAGVHGHTMSLLQARLIFRGIEHVSYRAISFGSEIGGEEHHDSDKLSDESFEHLLILRHALLPVRFGATMILEPYYPNRFARQFGFDQGIPADALTFCLNHRRKRSLENIALACAQFYRRYTGIFFHIPPDYHLGTYAYAYCGWWARVSAPYLTQSCSKIKTILTGQNCVEREPSFVIKDVSIITIGLKGSMKIPKRRARPSKSAHSVKSSSVLLEDSSMNVEGVLPAEGFVRENSPPRDVYFKRQRRRTRSESSDSSQFVGASSVPDVVYIPDDNVTFEVDNVALIEHDVPASNQDNTPALIQDVVLTLASHDDVATTSAEQPQTASKIENEPPVVTFMERTAGNVQPLVNTSLKQWAQNILVDGIKVISSLLSNLKSTQEISAERPHILQFLATLRAVAEHNDVDLSRYLSKVQDILDNVEVVTMITATVDVKHLEQLSAQIVELSLKFKKEQERLSHFEAQWSLDLQREEEELLLLKERVNEVELRIVSSKAKQVADRVELQDPLLKTEKEMQLLQAELDQAQVKLADSRLKEANIQALANEVITYSLFD